MSLTPPAMSQYPVTVAAGASETISLSASKVRVLSSDVDFKISFNDGPALFAAAGVRYQAVEGERFRRVTIHAPSATPVTVLISAANGLVDDDRVIFAGGGLDVDIVAQSLPVVLTRQNAPATFTLLSTLLTLTTVPVQAFGANVLRAKAYLFNIDPANFVDVRHNNGAGTGGVRLMPSTGIWLETSDDIWIYQASGGNVWVQRAELLW